MGRAQDRDSCEPEEAPGEAAAAPGATVDVDLGELIEAHNAIRKEHDLPPLQLEPRLTAAARAHALDMARNDFMAHEGSDGSTPAARIGRQEYPYQKVGENVAEGYKSVAGVMDGWMNSPPHRENILGDFEEIGAARATDAEGQPYWAVAFATPWPKLAPQQAGRDLVEAINAHRRASGKPALRTDPRLSAVAMQHAAFNADRESLAREASAGDNPARQVAARGYRYRSLAMADASGQPSAEEVVSTWVDEGGNRVDLLGSFRDVGTGYATDPSGRPYWSVILAQPLRR